MKKEINWRKILLFAAAFISLLFLYVKINDYITLARLQDTREMMFLNIQESKREEIENFEIAKQENKECSAPATLVMLENFYGYESTENDVAEEMGLKNRKYELLPSEYAQNLNKILSNKVVEIRSDIKDSEVIKIILDQLEKNTPVPVYYTDFKLRGKYRNVYGLVIGVDMSYDEVYVANTDGYVATLNINQFLESLKLKKDTESNSNIKLLIDFGFIKKNNIFVIR